MDIRIPCGAAFLAVGFCLTGCAPNPPKPVDKVKQQAEFQSYMASAMQGDAYAEERVGFDYLYGTGVVADDVQGEAWLEKAAAGGSWSAQNYLSPRCFKGEVAYCKYLKPFDSVLQAANAGDKLAQAQAAARYENGLEAPKDHELAEGMMDKLEHEDGYALKAYGEAVSDILGPVEIPGQYVPKLMQGKLGLLVIGFQYSAGHAINVTVVHTCNVKEIDEDVVESLQHLFLPPPPRDMPNVNFIKIGIDMANHNLPN